MKRVIYIYSCPWTFSNGVASLTKRYTKTRPQCSTFAASCLQGKLCSRPSSISNSVDPVPFCSRAVNEHQHLPIFEILNFRVESAAINRTHACNSWYSGLEWYEEIYLEQRQPRPASTLRRYTPIYAICQANPSISVRAVSVSLIPSTKLPIQRYDALWNYTLSLVKYMAIRLRRDGICLGGTAGWRNRLNGCFSFARCLRWYDDEMRWYIPGFARGVTGKWGHECKTDQSNTLLNLHVHNVIGVLCCGWYVQSPDLVGRPASKPKRTRMPFSYHSGPHRYGNAWYIRSAGRKPMSNV